MGIGRIARVGRVAKVGQGGLAAPLGAHDIVTITDDSGGSGGILMTTAAPHGLNGSETLVITGNSNANYNATIAFLGVPTPTTAPLDFPFAGNGTGGTWSIA